MPQDDYGWMDQLWTDRLWTDGSVLLDFLEREKILYTNILRDYICIDLNDYNGLLSEMCLGCPLSVMFPDSLGVCVFSAFCH